MKKLAVVLSEKELYIKGQPGHPLVLKWVIHNQSNQKWDKFCVLKNFCTEDAIVKPLFIQEKVQPDKIMDVTVTVVIPNEVAKDKVVLLFQFETTQGHRFGEPMVALIDISLNMD